MKNANRGSLLRRKKKQKKQKKDNLFTWKMQIEEVYWEEKKNKKTKKGRFF